MFDRNLQMTKNHEKLPSMQNAKKVYAVLVDTYEGVLRVYIGFRFLIL